MISSCSRVNQFFQSSAIAIDNSAKSRRKKIIVNSPALRGIVPRVLFHQFVRLAVGGICSLVRNGLGSVRNQGPQGISPDHIRKY